MINMASKKGNKGGLDKNRRMIRTKDVNDKGFEIIDEHFDKVRMTNDVEGLLVVDRLLYWGLQDEDGFDNEFYYSESTARRKLRLDGWKTEGDE